YPGSARRRDSHRVVAARVRDVTAAVDVDDVKAEVGDRRERGEPFLDRLTSLHRRLIRRQDRGIVEIVGRRGGEILRVGRSGEGFVALTDRGPIPLTETA